ncbi:MAG: hypothetical protein NC314_07150 [Roseburia sp.]|nr:hypothetical protein [Roseburia sp.]
MDANIRKNYELSLHQYAMAVFLVEKEVSCFMRNFQKKQLLEIISNLHTVHQRIREKLEQKDYETVQSVLMECQETAIQIGEAIEQIEGEGTETVGHLECYCETVYQLCVQLKDISPSKACKNLEVHLIRAENAVNHMVIKKTVFFLPYKASMWDSLESVWRAFSKDEEWISLVMPIPYFNKNEDGSIREMQYEGADFPSYVPIADWQQYSLEEEHPDIIFIHNPYDQYNYVTTVHPYFYASKIKKYTDKLVYIPYFVHQNDIVPEHYCVLPGTLHADMVILQSEKVREQYIKYYEAALPELVEKLGKNAIEQKFQALGSPKFDVTPIENMEIPDEWKVFLEKDKKVIFFNTHLKGLMKGQSEQFLQKLEWVFRFFGNRDDVVLLWRPHPLMVETARSMNPEAVEPYLRLVNLYRQQKIGIYDDSKDLHRAINLADAYYGSHSSVIELFKQQGKPVMIMSEQIIEN